MSRPSSMAYGRTMVNGKSIMKTLVLLTIALSLYGCSENKENKISRELFYQTGIQFEGNQQSRKEVVKLLDTVLKNQGDLGVYGDLSQGLETVLKEMNVKIEEQKDAYLIDIFPRKNTGGHDISFTIDKKTGKMSDVAGGEISTGPNSKD